MSIEITSTSEMPMVTGILNETGIADRTLFNKQEFLATLENLSIQELRDQFLSLQSHMHFNRETNFFFNESGWIEARKVLELGCGNGEFLLGLRSAFPDKTYCGVEIDPEVVKIAKERSEFLPSITFNAGNAEIFDESLRNQFDVGIFRNTLSHLKDPKQALLDMGQYLRPGGILIIIDVADETRFCSHPITEFEKAIDLLNQRGTQNRRISREILQNFETDGDELPKQFKLLQTNLDKYGRATGIQPLTWSGEDRVAFVAHSLYMLAILKRQRGIPVNMSAAYDEFLKILNDVNARGVFGTHIIVLRKQD